VLYVSLMVDKLECVLELGASFTKEAAAIRDEVRSSRESVIPFQKSRDYCAVVDLRKVMDVDALLHIQSRYGKHNDKLELLHTGEKKWDAICETISRVYAADPLELPTRRVDLACDMEDVTMARIVRTARVNFKRIERQFGKIEVQDGDGKAIDFQQISKVRAETLQLGVRPNLVRFYDKVAEVKSRYESMKREHYNEAAELVAAQVMTIGEVPLTDKGLNRGFRKRLKPAASRMYPFPSFLEWAGMLEWQVLTRVERQFGSDLPLTISTVKGLRENALSFNPFDNLQFAAEGASMEVSSWDYTPVEWLAGSMMWQLLESGEWSYQQLCKFLQGGRHGRRGGNLKRALEKFEPFIRRGSVGDEKGVEISSADLFERYRESMTRQLAA
jgi:hypothetical protein